MRRSSSIRRLLGLSVIAVVVSAHIGSPDVFFSGKAGGYSLRVVVRAPEVIPGIAHVTVHAPPEAVRISMRPVYWRAGTKGAPSADELRRLGDSSSTFVGSLWLMSRGANSVDVIIEGARGRAHVLVPVPAVATGRLELSPGLAAVLIALGGFLVAGLVNIVYKGAGESLVDAGGEIDPMRRRRARRVAAIATPVIALALLGGARWWNAVDRDYQRTMYRPSTLEVEQQGSSVTLEIADALFLPSRKAARVVPDHGKLMHLFVVRADDARAFAHLHPVALDTAAQPRFATRLPPLPAGTYRLYGDVVHETGFERTVVGELTLRDSLSAPAMPRDPDDAWFVGEATRERSVQLADGSTMEMQIVPNGLIPAGREETIRIIVRDTSGQPAALQPYLGMPAHAVVLRTDGAVYVHLHSTGTVSEAAREVFRARDRGDTTSDGRLRLEDHSAHAVIPAATRNDLPIEFPYAFPRSGSYRIFVQVKRDGRVLTGAFAVPVVEGK